MSTFTFGLDPEFMLQLDGEYKSAIDVVPGTKTNRYEVSPHQFYYDNVLAECAVAPAPCKEAAVEAIRDALSKYNELIGPCVLVPQASQKYPATELQHPDAFESGCKEEACAYKIKSIYVGDEIFVDNTLRTAGGHVHLGSDAIQDETSRLNIIRMMDLFIGIPSIYIDKDKTSKRRKRFYGQAGRYREPSYGVEYRSLGNFWLASPRMVELIYDLCEFCIKFVEDGEQYTFWEIDFDAIQNEDNWNRPGWRAAHEHRCKYDIDELQKAINSMDQEKGQSFLNIIQNHLPCNLWKEITNLAEEKEVPDLYQEWSIDRN